MTRKCIARSREDPGDTAGGQVALLLLTAPRKTGREGQVVRLGSGTCGEFVTGAGGTRAPCLLPGEPGGLTSTLQPPLQEPPRALTALNELRVE